MSIEYICKRRKKRIHWLLTILDATSGLLTTHERTRGGGGGGITQSKHKLGASKSKTKQKAHRLPNKLSRNNGMAGISIIFLSE